MASRTYAWQNPPFRPFGMLRCFRSGPLSTTSGDRARGRIILSSRFSQHAYNPWMIAWRMPCAVPARYVPASGDGSRTGADGLQATWLPVHTRSACSTRMRRT